MRGRKPKPVKLRVIAGNPSNRPIPKEVKVSGTLDDPPEWMSDSQKDGWRHAVEHAPAGVFGRIDRGVLTVWVVAEDMHRTAVMKVAKFGMLTKGGAADHLQQSPYLPIVNRQAQIMVKVAAELGFTPVSRTRIAAGDVSEKQNPFLVHRT